MSKSTLVYAPGVWDLLHYGHTRFLQRASELGDVLIVGVASDHCVLEDKGRFPTVSDVDRAEVLHALLCVDEVEIYYVLDFVQRLEHWKPDVLAIGEQWGSELRHRRAEAWVKQRGGDIQIIPYTNTISTTSIK